MAKCIKCGAETLLHVSGMPICLECDKKSNEERKPQAKELDGTKKKSASEGA